MNVKNTILFKSIALLLACAMPLCCCFVTAAAGSSSSCCGTTEVATCCEQPTVDWLDDLLGSVQQEDTNQHEPCDGTCCCVKACSPAQDWTPPVDTVGQDLPAFLTQHTSTDTFVFSIASVLLHPPPLIEVNQIGFSNAPPLRGAIILQV